MPVNNNFEGNPIDEAGARFRKLTGAIYARIDQLKWRLHWPGGTTIVVGDWAASAGFGSTATISAVSGTDTVGTVQVTPSGSGIAANPTLTLTFKDGAWATLPYATANMNASSTAGDGAPIYSVCTATTLVLTFAGTPTTARTYTFNYLVIGKDQSG